MKYSMSIILLIMTIMNFNYSYSKATFISKKKLTIKIDEEFVKDNLFFSISDNGHAWGIKYRDIIETQSDSTDNHQTLSQWYISITDTRNNLHKFGPYLCEQNSDCVRGPFFSPDGNNWSWVYTMYIDGQKQYFLQKDQLIFGDKMAFKEITNPKFSQKKNHWAFAFKQLKPLHVERPWNLLINGRRYYIRKELWNEEAAQKIWGQVKGRQTENFYSIPNISKSQNDELNIQFAPNGKGWAFAFCMKRNLCFAYIRKEASEFLHGPYDKIKNLNFIQNKDGDRYAISYMNKMKDGLFIEGKSAPYFFDEIQNIHFVKNTDKTWGFKYKESGKCNILISQNGVEYNQFKDYMECTSPSFSPNGNRWAFAYKENITDYWKVKLSDNKNDIECFGHDFQDILNLSITNEKNSYWGFVGVQIPYYTTGVQINEPVIFKGLEGEMKVLGSFSQIDGPYFTDNGNLWGLRYSNKDYISPTSTVKRGDGFYIYDEEQTGINDFAVNKYGQYDNAGKLYFSQTEKMWAFIYNKENKAHAYNAVINGEEYNDFLYAHITEYDNEFNIGRLTLNERNEITTTIYGIQNLYNVSDINPILSFQSEVIEFKKEDIGILDNESVEKIQFFFDYIDIRSQDTITITDNEGSPLWNSNVAGNSTNYGKNLWITIKNAHSFPLKIIHKKTPDLSHTNEDFNDNIFHKGFKISKVAYIFSESEQTPLSRDIDKAHIWLSSIGFSHMSRYELLRTRTIDFSIVNNYTNFNDGFNNLNVIIQHGNLESINLSHVTLSNESIRILKHLNLKSIYISDYTNLSDEVIKTLILNGCVVWKVLPCSLHLDGTVNCLGGIL